MMAKQIVAPLAGRVVQLNVKPGDTVDADEEILVIEAMKMETPVFVPWDGTIRDVRIKEGDEVAEDDILAIVDEKQTEV